jgi:hypothetical protein
MTAGVRISSVLLTRQIMFLSERLVFYWSNRWQAAGCLPFHGSGRGSASPAACRAVRTRLETRAQALTIRNAIRPSPLLALAIASHIRSPLPRVL